MAKKKKAKKRASTKTLKLPDKLIIQKEEDCPFCKYGALGKYALKLRLCGLTIPQILRKIIEYFDKNMTLRSRRKAKLNAPTLKTHLDVHAGLTSFNAQWGALARERAFKRAEDKRKFRQSSKRNQGAVAKNKASLFMQELKKTVSDADKLDNLVGRYSGLLDELFDHIEFYKEVEDDPSKILSLIGRQEKSLRSAFSMITDKLRAMRESATANTIDVNAMVLRLFLMYVVSCYDNALKDAGIPKEVAVQIHTAVRDTIQGWRSFIEDELQRASVGHAVELPEESEVLDEEEDEDE